MSLSNKSNRNNLRPGLIGAAVATVGLAVWALTVHRRAKRAERSNPPIGQTLDVDGVRLHVLERGMGDAVVLLHGNGSMIQDFVGSGLLDSLAQRYRVIAFDRPGYGYSERPRGQIWTAARQAELLRKALRKLGVSKPIIVGHSWGTLPALEIALQEPDEVRGLILLSGHYFPALRLDAVLLSPPALPLVGDIMRYTISPVLGRLLANRIINKVFAPRKVPPEFRANFSIAMALRPSQLRASAAESGLMLLVNSDAQSRYRELTTPVAIIAGEDDEIVDPRQSRQLHDELPDSTLRIAPGAGHMIHYAVPGAVVKAVEDISAGGHIASPANNTG